MRNKFHFSNEKIIRDNVHGDIFLEKKFIDIINAKEFQRLRRIKQLSVANYIFPCAEHTRFSHSLGTYHVMKMIIEHISNILKRFNIEIKQEEKEVALVSALLHDIGHGPFSHAFEGVTNKDHEQWTIEIIKSEETDVNKVLVSNFSKEFPSKVSALIEKSTPSLKNDINLHGILISLVSSQLDADRLDYLLRDSIFTGASFGKIDLQRIINSIDITANNDEYCLCFPEKYIGTLSDYLLARYQMNQGIYFHPCKIEFEKIISLIFQRIKEINCDSVSEQLNKVSQTEITLSEYIKLDDYVLMAEFSRLVEHEDKILSALCRTIVNREKYERLDILDNTEDDICNFYNEFIKICEKHSSSNIGNIEKYAIFKTAGKYNMYKSDKENIKIASKSGALKDISEVYSLFKSEHHSNKLFEENVNCCFINRNLLSEFINTDDFNSDVDNLINDFDNRHNIEVEMKYAIPKCFSFDDVLSYLREDVSFENISDEDIVQIDRYFDDDKLSFYNSNNTLRLREKNKRHKLTLKVNVEDDAMITGQHSRYEFNLDVNDTNINSHLGFINQKLDKPHGNLVNVLTIENNRKKVAFSYLNASFELAFDKYKCLNERHDLVCENSQIEIELTSELSHKVLLKKISDMFVNKFPELKVETKSKFNLAMEHIINN